MRRSLRQIIVSTGVIDAFESHANHLRDRKRQRASELQLRSHLEADQAVVVSNHDARDTERVVDEESFGVWKPGDVWQGDVCLRTLHDLLLKIDRKGCKSRLLNPVSIPVRPARIHLFLFVLRILLSLCPGRGVLGACSCVDLL